MRDQLVGFALGALDATERASLEKELEENPELRRELEILQTGLEPLRCDDGHLDPPEGLAGRVCRCVRAESSAPPPAVAPSIEFEEAGRVRPRWSFVDLAVAAGIVIAAGVFFFPTISHSRFNAQLIACQNKLKRIGLALDSFSEQNPRREFPAIPASGNLSVAGVYAPILIESGVVRDPSLFVCPASELACQSLGYQVPEMEKLEAASGEELDQMLATVCGSYGYNLGYMDKGKYRPTRNLGRPTFALLADSPCPRLEPHQKRSRNHGGVGQNVVFEDLQVRFLTGCRGKGCSDRNIFLNEAGRVAAGLHVNDAVIGHARARPVR